MISSFFSSDDLRRFMYTVSTISARSSSRTMPEAMAFSLFTGMAMRFVGM